MKQMRILILSLLFTCIASANMDIYPKKECQCFNNLKHTKNQGNIVLKLDRPYKMYVHHKGQYLVKVEGATPSQRWVDDSCMSIRPMHGTHKDMHTITKPTVKKTRKKYTVTSKQNLLALSWHNAFCETHRYKLECKYMSEYGTKHFSLHGLWPQPKSKSYCGVAYKFVKADKSGRWRNIPSLELDDNVKNELSKIMPGSASYLQRHEWIKHGSCTGKEANAYFKDAISLTKQVNNSELGKLFEQSIGEYLSLKEIKAVTNRTFGKGTGERVVIKCKRGLITELWLQLGTGSDDLSTLLKRGEPMHSRSCKGGRVDEVGYKK